MSCSHSNSPRASPLPSTSALRTLASPPPPSVTHLVPLGPDLVHGDSAIGVARADPDAVALDHLLHLVLDGQDGLPLAVGLGQRGLELLVGGDQALSQRQSGENPTYFSVNFTGLLFPSACV